jgi:hypothetical protein
MAWSISITPEGWQSLYEACHDQSKTWLFKAINEARKQMKEKRLPKKLMKQISQEAVANEAYQWIEKTNTCDNGGFYYWIDSKGYYKLKIAE